MTLTGAHQPGRRFLTLPLAATLGALVLAPTPARAEGADSASPNGPEISGSVALTSDYRFRGVSQTDIGPAIQPSLQIDTAAGVFVGFWGSNVADTSGATTEIDLSAGWAGTIGDLDASAGVLAYLYPGGSGTDVVELFGTLGLPIGPFSAGIGLNWAPGQANSGANRYAYAQLSAALPGTPVTLKGSIGHERGGFVFDETGRTTAKWDWQLGADIAVSALVLGVAYVGTDLPGRTPAGSRANRLGGDCVMLSVSAAF